MIRLIVMSSFEQGKYAEQLSSFLLTFSSALFVFAFGAVFILLQENYHKFNSTVFFKYIIKRCVPSFSISIVLLISCFLIPLCKIGSNLFVLICAFSIALGLLACICLIRVLRLSLDYKKMIDKVLLPSITKSDIELYKAGELSEKENRIDSSLKIVLGAINNDVIATEEVFYSIISWLYTNWNAFSLDKKHDIQNKFFQYLTTIFEAALSSQNYMVQANLINSLYNEVVKIKFEQLKSFSHLFMYIKGFLLRGLDRRVDSSITLSLFDLLLCNCLKYVASVESEEEYAVVQNTILTPVSEGVRKAITLEDCEVLRNLKMYETIFAVAGGKEDIEWNSFSDKLLIALLEMENAISGRIKDYETFNAVLLEVEFFDWMIMPNDSSSSDSSINILIHLSTMIFENYIDIALDKIDFNSFSFLFTPFIETDYKPYARDKSSDRFFIIIDYYLAKISSTSVDYLRIAYRVLYKLDKVIERLSEDEGSFALFESLSRKREELFKKYESLLSEYEEFTNSEDIIIGIIKGDYSD